MSYLRELYHVLDNGEDRVTDEFMYYKDNDVLHVLEYIVLSEKVDDMVKVKTIYTSITVVDGKYIPTQLHSCCLIKADIIESEVYDYFYDLIEFKE